MLHTNTIDSQTLELLKAIQRREYLNGFHLAGGTALSLYMGHRTSIDINLFSIFSFDASLLLEAIQQDYPFQVMQISSNAIRGRIDNVSVDIIAHRYPYIQQPILIEGISLYSMEDIIAMKLNAICTSGQRPKDFIDIFFCLDTYNIGEMIGFYQNKYNQEGDSHVLKSMIYFEDVDLSDWPVILKNKKLKWEVVKAKIEIEVVRYIKSRS